MGERKTIELNIPRTAEERAKASNEWHCAGCGAPVPDLVKRCDCSTMVACKEGVKSVWMIDPNESPCVINLRNCQTQLDADGCQVGVSRQALEETLADYSRLRSEVERLTKLLSERNTECGKWFKAGEELRTEIAQLRSTFNNYANSTETEDARLRSEVERLTKERDNTPAVYQFGMGAIVVDTGSVLGRPAVFIKPSQKPGPLGASAKDNRPLDRMVEGEIALTFPTEDQAKFVADVLCEVGLHIHAETTLREAQARAETAEKSRDEAVAELNKALETLGQLRSDLQRVEDERWAFEKEATKQTVRAASAETDLGVQRARAEDAEASLAKLREAGRQLIATGAPYDFIGHVATQMIVNRNKFDALRSLLDEHDKDQNNAKSA